MDIAGSVCSEYGKNAECTNIATAIGTGRNSLLQGQLSQVGHGPPINHSSVILHAAFSHNYNAVIVPLEGVEALCALGGRLAIPYTMTKFTAGRPSLARLFALQMIFKASGSTSQTL